MYRPDPKIQASSTAITKLNPWPQQATGNLNGVGAQWRGFKPKQIKPHQPTLMLNVRFTCDGVASGLYNDWHTECIWNGQRPVGDGLYLNHDLLEKNTTSVTDTSVTDSAPSAIIGMSANHS